jgi:hypothetical protein
MAIQKISSTVIGTGAVTSDQIASGAITVADIPDGEISTAKIADDAITNAKIAADSVTSTEIANGSVTYDQIADGTIITSKIADGQITTSKIADGNITSAKISNNAVTEAQWGGGQIGGRRNLIINGGFDVWQRGTTLNTTDYSADRWMQWMTNSGVSNRNVNCTKQTGGPIGRNSSYITYAPQVVDTGMEKFAWGQKIEKINLDHIESGQQLTLSFWIKREQSLPVDNNLDIQILYPNSTNSWGIGYLWRGDTNIDQTLGSISFNSLSTAWTKYSYTFVPSDIALDRGLAVYWHVGDTDFNLNNTNALISFTGVQLEVGSVATPFEHRPYGEELALCQRYYIQYPHTVGFQIWNHNIADTGGSRMQAIPFPTQMRVAPSASYTDDQGTSGQIYVENPNSTNTRTTFGMFTTETMFRGGFKYPYGALYGSNGDSSYATAYNVKLDAEL